VISLGSGGGSLEANVLVVVVTELAMGAVEAKALATVTKVGVAVVVGDYPL